MFNQYIYLAVLVFYIILFYTLQLQRSKTVEMGRFVPLELKFGSILQFCFYNELTTSVCSKISEFCYCVKKTNNVIAIPVSSIFVKCVYIPIKEAQCDIIVTMPNMFEHHYRETRTET